MGGYSKYFSERNKTEGQYLDRTPTPIHLRAELKQRVGGFRTDLRGFTGPFGI